MDGFIIPDLPPEMNETPAGSLNLMMEKTPRNAEELKQVKARLRRILYGRVEENFVIEALNRAGWNVTHAAELVDMQRPNFHALMRKYGIKARDVT